MRGKKYYKYFITVLAVLVILTPMFATATHAQGGFEEWGINWRQFEGQHVSLGFVKHPFTDSITPLLPQFEELTGITVGLEVLSEIEYREKLLVDLAAHAGIYDVFMVGPRYAWKYYYSGWIEPLDPFLADPNLTDAEKYDFNDFYPQHIAPSRWTGEIGKGLGEGYLLEIPLQEEQYALFYRKDILEAFGKEVPTTWDELYETAVELTGKEFEGEEIYGFVARGHRDDSTFVTWLVTVLSSFGGKIFDEELNCIVNNPDGVEAFDYAAKLLRDAGPPGATAFTWYETKSGFGVAGKYVFCIDADHWPVTFENPEISNVVGKVGYTITPAGKAGHQADMWTWSIAMNRFSDNKGAAWLFMEWATSKEIMLKTALEGNMDPVRKSVWEAPEVVEATTKWGSREMNNEINKFAKTSYPPLPNMVEIADRLTRAFQEILLEERTAQEALDDAAMDINDMVRPFKK